MVKIICVLSTVFILALIGDNLEALGAIKVRANKDSTPTMKVAVSFSGLHLNSVAIADDNIKDLYIVENSSNGPVEHGKIGKIAVGNVGIKRTSTNNLEVFAVLKNRTDDRLQMQGRIHFFDDMGMPVEEPSAWQRMYFSPNSMLAYKEFSTHMDAVYYYIEIREAT